jgi:hypothetical protein
MGADNQRTLLRFDAMEALLKTYGAGVSPWKRPQPTRMTWGRHAVGPWSLSATPRLAIRSAQSSVAGPFPEWALEAE